MRTLIFILIFFIPLGIIAQQKPVTTGGGTAKGIVKDSLSGYGLQAVTVTVYKKSDSALLDYKLTNSDGEFSFTGLPLGTPVIFNFSFTGYKSYSKTITTDSTHKSFDFKNIIMGRSYGALDEVVVEVPVPIRMNGDTLEINPDAFHLDKNAVVEDMLRRVPGMTIWGDGSITVNGKPIDKVFVDGKPFFGGDPAIATQNLPKDAIDKIQVYQEIDETMYYVDMNPEDSVFTMDIKLKDNKKSGMFGKVGAGMGTDSRYESDATVQAYNNKSRLGLMGVANNINKIGDMRSIARQSTYRNFNPSNSYVADFRGSGINKILQGGLNFQHDFSDLNNRRFNNQFTGNYNVRRVINNVSSNTNSRQSGSGVVFINESDRMTSSNRLSNSFNAGYNKRERNKDFSLNANYNTGNSTSISQVNQNSSNENTGLVSTNINNTSSQSNNDDLSFSASYRNRDDDERDLKSFNVSYNLSYGENTSERRTVSDFVSLVDPDQSSYLNRVFNNSGTNLNNSVNFGYNALKRLIFGNFNFWDINIGFNNRLSFSNSTNDNIASNFDTASHDYSQNTYLTYDNDVARVEERPSLRFSKNFSKNLTSRFSRHITVAANIDGQFLSDKNSSSISDRNLNRSYSFILPGASVNYNFRKMGRYEISMNLNQSNSSGVPSIDQLYPIIDSTNQYSFTLGNADLKPFYNNNISYDFKYTKQHNQDKSELNISAFFRAGQTKNGITDSSFYSTDGSRDIYLINIEKGKKNWTTGVNINTSFKMKNNKILQLGYATNYSKNISPNYIDGIYSMSRNNNFNNNVNIFFALQDLATFHVSQGVNFSNSVQTGKNLKSFKNTTYNTNAGINLNFPKNFSIGNTFSYINSKSTDQSSSLWNAFVTYRFLKTKAAEVKFSAMDILRQNNNISVNASANNLTTTVTNGLQQFYMVTLSYYPRKFGGGGGSRGGGQRGGGGNWRR